MGKDIKQGLARLQKAFGIASATPGTGHYFTTRGLLTSCAYCGVDYKTVEAAPMGMKPPCRGSRNKGESWLR